MVATDAGAVGMLSLRPGEELSTELLKRPGKPGGVAKRDLSRYYRLVSSGRQATRTAFSDDEWRAWVAFVATQEWTPGTFMSDDFESTIMSASLNGFLSSPMARQWGSVSGLYRKIARLSMLQRTALVDSAETDYLRSPAVATAGATSATS